MTTNNNFGERPGPGHTVPNAVIQSVAERTGQRPTELPSLFATVDPDALDSLVESAQRNGTPISIRFTFDGHEVTVDESATVRSTES